MAEYSIEKHAREVLDLLDKGTENMYEEIHKALTKAHREGRREGVDVGRGITAIYGRPLFE